MSSTQDELNRLSKKENWFTFLWNESSVVEICLKKSKKLNSNFNAPWWAQLKMSSTQELMSSTQDELDRLSKNENWFTFLWNESSVVEIFETCFKKIKKIKFKFHFLFFCDFLRQDTMMSLSNSRWAQLKMSSTQDELNRLSKKENWFTFLWNESSVVEICLKKSKKWTPQWARLKCSPTQV